MEKIIHQIWVGDFKIPLREKQLMQNIKELHSDYEYKLWTESDDLPMDAQYCYDKFYKIKNYAFCADILRLWVVYKYGGFYLDIDFDIKQRLDPFFEEKAVFFYHNDTDFTIPNNIFASESGSEILKHCIDSVNPYNTWYGPSWLGQTIKSFLRLDYEIPQQQVMDKLSEKNIKYFEYYQFEKEFGKHLSLYSWSPEIWNKLNNNEQL